MNMAWRTSPYHTVSRARFDVPPWFGIGPVLSGGKVVGFSLHFGQFLIAFHKNVAQEAKEYNHE